MTSLELDAAFDEMGRVHAPETVNVRVRSRALRLTQRAALAYAADTLATAGVAILLVKAAGPVVWLAAGFVVLELLLEFATLRPYERLRSLRPAKHLIVTAGAGLLLSTVFGWLTPEQVRGALFVVAVSVMVVTAAVVVQQFTRTPRSILLVGDRVGVGQFIAQWGSRAEIEMKGICLADFVDESAQEIVGIPILGSLDDVAGVAIDLAIDEVVAAPGPMLSAHDVRRMSWALENSSIELSIAVGMHGAAPRRIQPRILGRRLLLSVRPGRPPGLSRWIKGAIDRIGATLTLILFGPVFLALAIVIRRDSPGPAFFTQTRTGLDGKPFRMYKFRTMVVDAESLLAELMTQNEGTGPLFKMAEDPRTTRAGRLLRRTSLDELPQLLNVVKGDMSLIGPRPGLPIETVEYDSWVRRRLKVKPGITGAWQVSGRSNLSWQDSVRLDLDYVDNWTLHDDLAIAAKTARAVIRREGAM